MHQTMAPLESLFRLEVEPAPGSQMQALRTTILEHRARAVRCGSSANRSIGENRRYRPRHEEHLYDRLALAGDARDVLGSLG
jgi:hypothetical protein